MKSIKKFLSEFKQKILQRVQHLQYEKRTRRCFIPWTDMSFNHVRNHINEGEDRGKKSHYLAALLNTLISLRPQYCLEIGTYRGGSAKAFAYYFKHYRPDGVLITVDIKKYVELKNPHIRQVIVYPHLNNLFDIHTSIKKDELLSGWENQSLNSLQANLPRVKEVMKEFNIQTFDFAYVDGDHQKVSFLRDWEMACALTKDPHIIFIDDTRDAVHECARVYREEIKPTVNSYDFEDWPVFVGAGLTWDKQAVLRR